MTYLLDTNVVSYFLQARREADLASAASMVPCQIADEARQELSADSVRGPAFDRWLPASHLEVRSIAVGSDADSVLGGLQINITSAHGRGERASIALAATDPSLVFTAMDKGALWIALRELWQPGERLISLAVFLRRLVDARALSGDAAEDVLQQSRHIVPTWWPAWRATR